jgi:TonB family protein
MVHAHLARFHHVPIDMTQRRDSGEAVIRFSIDAQGRVGSVRLLRSSGNARIDAEAQATARRASPFPQPPDRRGQEFDAPLRYSVR